MAFIRETIAITVGHYRALRRNHTRLVYSAMQPALFVIMFVLILGGSVKVPGQDYASYIIPGILVYQTLFSAARTATIIAFDVTRGVADRYRALPIYRSSFLAARSLGDIATNAVSVAAIVLSGLLVGWRPKLSLTGFVIAFMMLLCLSLFSSSIGLTIGLSVRTPEIASQAVMAWFVPLVFLSNMLVTPDSLPGWLRAISTWNPVSIANELLRYAFGQSTNSLQDYSPDSFWAAMYLAFFVAIVGTGCTMIAVRKFATLERSA